MSAKVFGINSVISRAFASSKVSSGGFGQFSNNLRSNFGLRSNLGLRSNFGGRSYSSTFAGRLQKLSTLSPIKPKRLPLLKWSIPFLVASSVIYTTRSPIVNDTAFRTNQFRDRSILGQRVSYEELTLGSITGLFFGAIIGKLSTVISLLALGGYFFVQFLESRNIIHIPWNSIITVGRETFDVKNLVLEKVGFKVCFALSFVIAAYNI